MRGEGILPQMLSDLWGDLEVGEHLAATRLDTGEGAPFSPSSELGFRRGLSHLALGGLELYFPLPVFP